MRLTRRGRIFSALVVLLVILGIVAIPVVLWLRSLGLLKPSDPGGPVTLTLPRGAGTADIGDLLEDRGVIDSAFGFRIAAYLEGGAEDIQAGEYTLPRGLSAQDALDRLLGGPKEPEVVRLTFPEGSWLEEFGSIVEDGTTIPAADFVAVATSGRVRSRYQPRSVDNLEGLLFPSTYEFVRSADAKDIVERLVAEFDQQFSGIGGRGPLGLSAYETVIVASMIEAEARVDAERPKIASVIYNRLDEAIPLGIDATIIYGLGERGRTLTTSDLQTDSPFNTRERVGLPPRPIGSPGLSSLRAALRPAQTDLFYYVLSDCAGHHAFSETYDEFVEDKAAYQELEC